MRFKTLLFKGQLYCYMKEERISAEEQNQASNTKPINSF